ncbi:MAG: LysM peptidoglycan-binding domain-containing protein [Crocinitomicaceae bacterium]|nr:LysM peptidoglycan-binding domain-containing protein [Crocinitomicaceae bacterium]
MKVLVSYLFLLLVTLPQSARASFWDERREIFSQSANQWMCRQLRKESPGYFDCSTFTPTILTGESISSEPFLGIPLEIDQQQAGIFRAIFFQQNDCSVFLTLKSLCDLYFPLFERKLEQHKLPREYKYLSLLLSGLNPHFTDKNNRAGLWALDYTIARKYGLRVDSLIDERRGGDFTCDKTMEYLSDLYHKYNGDHAKVLLSFYKSNAYVLNAENSGTATFLEAVDPDGTDFLRFFIYSAKLFEAVTIENQLSNYFDILGLYEGVFFKSDVREEALIQLTESDAFIMKQINPVYCGNTIEGSYRRVPFMLHHESAEKFRQLEQDIYNWKPPQTHEIEKRVFHVVKKGETLGKIAAKYNVSSAQIKKWNKLKRDFLRTGQKLLIIKKKIVIAEPDTLTNSQPDPLLSSGERPEKPSGKPVMEENDSEAKIIYYVVRQGDSLWTIAKNYKSVTPEKLMEWNNCGASIRPGQKLKIIIR